MIAVDSSVWIDWLHGTRTAQVEHLDDLLDKERLVVGDLVLAEVLQGIARPDDIAKAQRRLLAFELVTISSVQVALAAADYYRRLRVLGRTPRGTIDTLIATRCIAEGWPLLASDRDYQPFAEHLGLELIG